MSDVIIIEAGRQERWPAHVLGDYLCDTISADGHAFDSVRIPDLSKKARLISFNLDTPSPSTIRQPFAATLRVEVREPLREIVFGVAFNAPNGQRVLTCDSDFDGRGVFSFSKPGEYVVHMSLPALPLWPARYILDAGCRTRSGRMLDAVVGFTTIEVVADERTAQIGIGSYPTACCASSWGVPADAASRRKCAGNEPREYAL